MFDKSYFKTGLIFGLLIAIYYSIFIWLVDRFTAADTYYSHGFLIPFVSTFFIWRKRKELTATVENYSLWGLALIIFSLILHLVSTMSEFFFVSGLSIISLLFGISLFLFGIDVTKKVRFPLTFLIFMIPIPLVAINTVSFPLKMLVTKAAVFILRALMHIPVRNEGFQVFFPNGSLIVENVCSGLRSLITMLALGSIFAYTLKGSLIKRNALFLLSVPAALVSNLIRVIILCLGVYIYGGQITKTFFHDFSGYLMFGIAFLSLYFPWRKLNA